MTDKTIKIEGFACEPITLKAVDNGDGSATLKVAALTPANVATAQVSVGTSATPVVAARADRSAVTLVNHGATDVYLGGVGVAMGTGIKLPASGAPLTLHSSAAIYAVAASGTVTVGALETF